MSGPIETMGLLVADGGMHAPLLALFGWLPGLVFGLPLVLVASIIFAATHHESPEGIRVATIQWLGWLGGILGAVLAVVLVVGWLV